MKYNGIELKEFKSNKAVIFNIPKKMIVWDSADSKPIKLDVYAYLPALDLPVKSIVKRWKHCAEIPA